MAPSNSVSGTILVDATRPTVTNQTSAPGRFITETQPVISAVFSDDGSGVASLSVRLDTQPIVVTVVGGSFAFTPDVPLDFGGLWATPETLPEFAPL